MKGDNNMPKKLWLLHEYYAGEEALFTTEKAALLFRNALDRKLIELGEGGIGPDDVSIREIEVNPDFETWWNS